jgi:hypothetical protein
MMTEDESANVRTGNHMSNDGVLIGELESSPMVVESFGDHSSRS